MRAVCIFSILLIPYFLGGQPLVVGGEENIRTIREAVSLAMPGDTIIIMPGIYREGNLKLQKPVVLIGEGFPILDGEDKYEVITVSAPHVTIKGLTIRNSGVSGIHDLAGIGGENCHYLNILNNRFENTFFGIHLSAAKRCRVEENILNASAQAEHQSGNGIHFWQCDNMAVRNNYIKGHRDGIYFEFVTNSIIEKNISEQNLRYGLHFMFSNDDNYFKNTFRNNGAGVAVMYSRKVTMVENVFDQNWGSSAYGLLLKDIRDSHVENNSFVKNTTGIYMEGTSRSMFLKNTFHRNGWAVKLQASCDDNVFSFNDFVANTFDVATNGTMVLNRLEKNYWDKYEGYDLNKDGVGDVPFRPVSMYSMVVERMPTAVMLWRSFLVFLLDRSEKVIPAVTPENLKDDLPMMRAYDYTGEGT